jgi:hypothetical protein
MDALIGHTGFVGSNLATQHGFAAHFNSASIEAIQGRRFATLVMAGAQGRKWWANQNPEADRAGIARALACLDTVQADHVVLISTIDVLPQLAGADERFDPTGLDNHPYGANRLWLEQQIARRFATTTVRLPGLHGPGLRKNILFDLRHDNQVDRIDPASAFQFYDLTRLWADIALMRAAGLRLAHLVPAPLATRDIAARLFPAARLGPVPTGGSASYDVRTRHAGLFGGADGYLYSADEAMARITAWARG